MSMATARQSVMDAVDVLDLRHYGSAELRPLLRQESALWAEHMDWDYRGSMEMVLRYIDSRILPGYVAVENGHIAGYAFFVYEGSKGVVGDLFVSCDDPFRESAVRGRLLTHVIETLQQTPGVQRIESQLLTHDTGAIATPFLQQGFRLYQRLFMQLPLRMAPRPVPNVAYDIRPWAEADFHSAAQVITASYAGHIDAQINDQYRSAAGSLRFLNNIVRFPGCGVFDPGSSFGAMSRVTGALAGLILCSKVREDVGHVTQICVLPQHRGQGLGALLMAECCQALTRRKFTELSLTVTEANREAVTLYKKMGFSTRRVFDAFVWEAEG